MEIYLVDTIQCRNRKHLTSYLDIFRLARRNCYGILGVHFKMVVGHWVESADCDPGIIETIRIWIVGDAIGAHITSDAIHCIITPTQKFWS